MLGKKRANVDRIQRESGAESMTLLKAAEAEKKGDRCPCPEGARPMLVSGTKAAVKKAVELIAESLGISVAQLEGVNDDRAPADIPGKGQKYAVG